MEKGVSPLNTHRCFTPWFTQNSERKRNTPIIVSTETICKKQTVREGMANWGGCAVFPEALGWLSDLKDGSEMARAATCL